MRLVARCAWKAAPELILRVGKNNTESKIQPSRDYCVSEVLHI